MTDTTSHKMLERVRALLAKADSTNFPEEAEAFRAKADELMTRHSISQWAIQQAEAGRSAPIKPERRDFERAWRASKHRSDLFWMFESVANHCRCVVGHRGSHGESIPVYGLASDLDYLDVLFTTLNLEVARNMSPPVDPNGELGAEVFKQRQAGISWPEITRKVFRAGLVTLTKGEFTKLQDKDHAGDLDGMDREEVTWDDIKKIEPWDEYNEYQPVKQSIKNRLANANRRYVRDHGLQGERNYVKPEVYQRSFMMGFRTEVTGRLRRMSEASRTAYDADHDAGSMALAVRDMRAQAMELYNQEFPPPPPVEIDPNYKPPKGRAIKMREVRVDYGAMGKGRDAGSRVNLTNPGRGVGGNNKEIGS
jgi:hypothetical protein